MREAAQDEAMESLTCMPSDGKGILLFSVHPRATKTWAVIGARLKDGGSGTPRSPAAVNQFMLRDMRLTQRYCICAELDDLLVEVTHKGPSYCQEQ